MDESTVEGRMPPHDLEAEAAMVSAGIIDPDAMPAVAGFLLPEHFYSEAYRRMYEAVLAVFRSGAKIDTVVVAAWLQDRERLAQVGGREELTRVINTAPIAGNARPWGERIHALWNLRQVLAQAQRVTAQIYGGVVDARAFTEKTASVFHELAFAPIVSADLERMDVSLGEVLSDCEAAERTGRGMIGLPTGLPGLDRVFGGLGDGDLTILAARPGKGKSALGLGIAVHVASEVGPAVVFSLEMPKKQLALRAACSEARVNVKFARIGRLAAEDWRKLRAAQKFLAGLPLYIDPTPAITVAAIRARLARLSRELARNAKGEAPRPRLVLVDYLQLVRASDGARGSGSREREVAEVAQELKEIAKEFSLHVIACCQMNRDIENSNRMPKLRDLRESGAIEQAADNVVFLHESKEEHQVQLCVEKQRNGPPDIVHVRFDPIYTRFDSLAESDYGGDLDEPEPLLPRTRHAASCGCPACRVVHAAAGGAA